MFLELSCYEDGIMQSAISTLTGEMLLPLQRPASTSCYVDELIIF